VISDVISQDSFSGELWVAQVIRKIAQLKEEIFQKNSPSPLFYWLFFSNRPPPPYFSPKKKEEMYETNFF